MKSTIISIIASALVLAIVLFFTWALPVFATVALVSKVIFTIIAVGFVSLMSYAMVKTELELQAISAKYKLLAQA